MFLWQLGHPKIGHLPLDGSPLAEIALQYAKVINRQGTPITLLRVVDLPLIPSDVGATAFGLPSDTLADPILREQALAYLRKVQSEFDTSFSSIAIEVIDSSDPATAIVAFSNENAIDLIVMVSHCRSGISRWLLGSITQKVLQAASCPALVVPRKVVEAEAQDLSMLDFTPNLPVAAT